jgi:hypothetical protein
MANSSFCVRERVIAHPYSLRNHRVHRAERQLGIFVCHGKLGGKDTEHAVAFALGKDAGLINHCFTSDSGGRAPLRKARCVVSSLLLAPFASSKEVNNANTTSMRDLLGAFASRYSSRTSR